jgi:hypothetical protein
MPKKVSKNPIKKKRAAKRTAKLKKQGRIVRGVEISADAIPGNPREQNRGTGNSAKLFYKDIHYTCAGCGKDEVWTAAQQKKYFEDQKGNIYNEPKWCHACHIKRMSWKKRSP